VKAIFDYSNSLITFGKFPIFEDRHTTYKFDMDFPYS
jgi:hypothetical protein